jgi:hypothetical protein
MVSKVFCLNELEVLVDELDRHVYTCELRRQVRPPIWEKLSPETYRSAFRVSEVLRVAYEVAKERGVEEPWKEFQQLTSDKNSKE